MGEWIRFLGGNSSSGIKKYRGLNSNDGGNTGDRVKIDGGVIRSGDEIEFSEELKELLPIEDGKESDETEAHDAALDDGALLVKRCGYFFLNWSSRSHVNSGPLLEFPLNRENGIQLRFND
ncbi:hypothetical protein Tco_0812979 [Tanacetum coccineum]